MNDTISRCMNCGNPMEPMRSLAMPICDECFRTKYCIHWHAYKCDVLQENDKPYHCECPIDEDCEEYEKA